MNIEYDMLVVVAIEAGVMVVPTMGFWTFNIYWRSLRLHLTTELAVLDTYGDG